MKLLKFFSRMFKDKLPLWAYGVECQVCKKSYRDPEAHYYTVLNDETRANHEGKVPYLRR